MELELRHLTSLCAIADAGSVSRAAALLGVSQPALTAQLQRVERELGAQVFVRDRKGVTPTPLGQSLLTRARGVLLAMDELRRDSDRRGLAAGPVVRLGGIAGAVSVGLADRLSDQLPDAEVHLRTEYSPRVLWDLLMASRLDAAALVDYPGFALRPPATVLSQVIAVEPVFVAMSERHRLADRASVALSDLADEPWALTPYDGAGWPDCFYAVCGEAGFTPRVLYTVSDGTPIRELVATGRAVTPCQAVFACGNGVLVKPLEGDPVRMRHILACRADSPLAENFDVVLRLACDAYWAYAQRRPDYLSWLGN
ncbi:LysR family transcriptional regulator [Actinokineospora sp. UTMC 2448]|uniref:LysR substrate-binding domain-containing protein n=1 Tax=Actinokineospora sp. UTMC 2448 TaxID=2268449 RepID=UPI002164046C|nr:LysR family transcriptional regulator [Actinokineospora sp. UTMC 2448]UVS81326.1 HTH-type transcriptional regulator GltC [Actinokineospora sp. UTMC 2448]